MKHTPPLPSGWRIDAAGVMTDETGVERYVMLPDGKMDRLKIAVVLSNFGGLEDYAQAWRGNSELIALCGELKTALAEANDCDAAAEGENSANFRDKRQEFDALATRAGELLASLS